RPPRPAVRCAAQRTSARRRAPGLGRTAACRGQPAGRARLPRPARRCEPARLPGHQRRGPWRRLPRQHGTGYYLGTHAYRPQHCGQRSLMPDLRTVQQRIDDNLGREGPALIELSHRIHANPEIRLEEVLASGTLCDELTARGFEVDRGVAGLPTAFKAVKRGRPGGPRVAVLCEYDALPGLGHACGHNVIATMGAGAGFALAPLMDDMAGTLVVLGTPAEEGGGGKVIMLEAGVFDDIDAA